MFVFKVLVAVTQGSEPSELLVYLSSLWSFTFGGRLLTEMLPGFFLKYYKYLFILALLHFVTASSLD